MKREIRKPSEKEKLTPYQPDPKCNAAKPAFDKP
jgi:hypothetical protein